MGRERRTLTTDAPKPESKKESTPSDIKDLLPSGNLDGRSKVVKRYKEVLDQIVSDLGYEFDDIPMAKLQLAKRAAGLSWRLEMIEIAQLNGEDRLPTGEPLADIDVSKLTNTLVRVLSTLGIDRKQRDSGAFTLDDYFGRHK